MGSHNFVSKTDRYDASAAVPDLLPPGVVDSKRVDIAQVVADCTAEPRPVAFMEANFDNVFVNQSAAQ